jgi:hypothetical protein
MNYTEINLDLQGTVKRIYDNLLYKSSFYKMLNDDYIGELRQAGVPMIEVLKTGDVTINTREKREIQERLTPSLMGYNSVKVDLTELAMDYSVRIPVLIGGSDIYNTIQSAMEKKDSAVAKAIDTYGFGKLASDTDIQNSTFATSDTTSYVDLITALSAKLFNADVYETYRLGLSATEYGKYVSALTSILKYETMSGVQAVDRGIVANAYGVETFQINDSVLGKNGDSTIKGYFFNKVAVVGDSFFDAFVQHNSPQGFPGYYIFEGNILFGAKVIEPSAIIRLI